MKSPIELLGGLLEDLGRLNPDVEGLDRDFITIQKRFENEGYGFLTVSLQALDAALLQGLSTRLFACPTGFKKIRGGAIPRLFSGLLCKVFDPFSGILREDADLGVIWGLREVLRLFKKMQLEQDDEAKLHVKAVTEFYQCDDVAKRVVIPDRHAHLIGRVSRLLLNTLNSKDVQNAIYRHGPGSVEEGLKSNQKWQDLSNTLRSGVFDGSDFGLDVQAQYHNVTRAPIPFGIRYDDSDRRSDGQNPSLRRAGRENGPGVKDYRSVPLFDEASRRIARLVTVAKDSSSRRTITVEPMVNQFVQQGLNTLLRESISECKILGNSLALTDQSKNQELALEGSLYDNWATIDLKSASDLLSVKLVELVFGHHGQFFDHMMDCRSPSVYSDLTVAKPLGKFAGMGNALTFPVQSVCFATVVLAAIMDSEGTTPTYWNLRRASRHIRVYGDDIVVSRKYAHQAVNWLHDVGLKVNVKKSFLEGNFKESCGIDAYKGVLVTPLYMRYRPDSNSTDPSIIAGLVALSNHMWMRCLYKASTLLANEVERRLGKALPLVSRDSGLLGWWSRQDASTVHKWCSKRHHFLVRGDALSAIKRKDVIDDYAALLKYFCTSVRRTEERPSLTARLGWMFPDEGNGSDHLVKTSMRYKSRIKSSWVPVRLTA